MYNHDEKNTREATGTTPEHFDYICDLAKEVFNILKLDLRKSEHIEKLELWYMANSDLSPKDHALITQIISYIMREYGAKKFFEELSHLSEQVKEAIMTDPELASHNAKILAGLRETDIGKKVIQ